MIATASNATLLAALPLLQDSLMQAYAFGSGMADRLSAIGAIATEMAERQS